MSRALWAWVLLLATGAAAPARALQPLRAFLEGARRASVDGREAALAAVEQDEQALVAIGRALPSFNARGVYTRNQYEASFTLALDPTQPPRNLVLQPFNQLDAYLQLDVPIVDVSSWLRADAARSAARAGKKNAQGTLLEVQKRVAGLYYQLVGAEALRESAQRLLTTAEQNHVLTQERRAGGVATALDVERAAAEVERARQAIADAELLSQLARRSLRTLSGMEAEGPVAWVADDLHEEAPLERWEGTPDLEVPFVAAALEQSHAAATQALAAKLSLLPTVAGTALERFTNAPGFFFGHRAIYSLQVTLNWHFDVATVGMLRAQAQQAGIAELRAERARLLAHDQIHESWQRVRADIVKSRAASAQVKAAKLAAEYARERYESGAGTQLELVQSQRDAFAAEVARIQADADLALARASLRLNAGRPLDGDTP